MRRSGISLAAAVSVSAALVVSGCVSGPADRPAAGSAGTIVAVGAENEYASVIRQVGGKYVSVFAIMSNPATDPHTYEASSSVAQEISSAQLVVQNGAGYDSFMTTIENAAPDSRRKVIDVQKLLGLPADLAALQPAHASYFRAGARAFIGSLARWDQAIASFRATYPDTPVAVTEPVADYLLQAAGTDIMTPLAFQADVMNGVDPSAQDVALERGLFTQHKVKVFLYNQQVTSTLTRSFVALAQQNNIPVVGVYETMPQPGYDYQSWMLAETRNLQQAVASKKSAEKL
jgi:zinc/manganese transport system substrate-binding protein